MKTQILKYTPMTPEERLEHAMTNDLMLYLEDMNWEGSEDIKQLADDIVRSFNRNCSDFSVVPAFVKSFLEQTGEVVEECDLQLLYTYVQWLLIKQIEN